MMTGVDEKNNAGECGRRGGLNFVKGGQENPSLR
jgi:hypothetical protein